MSSGSTSPFTYVGTLGELYVEVELLKRKIYSQRMSVLFDYDLLTSNNKRVEVKTAKPTISKKIHKEKTYSSKLWQFRNYDKGNIPWHEIKGRQRECDFYVFVCLDEEEKPLKFYIVPQDTIKATLMIRVSDAKKNKFFAYKDQWDLLK